MCGIAGVFGPGAPDPGRIEKTLRLMENRGPDAHGVFRSELNDNQVTLLHTRLAIIDLDPRSNQPFEHDECVISYNGEIYNFIELRAELKKLGCTFRTHSDTEVIVQAYRQFGEACIDRFEGMWAFALFDRRESKLILCRDRFGEKPLYYMWVNGALYFGSEVKFLIGLSGHKPPVNMTQIQRYLVNGYKSLYKQPATFYDGVHEMPQAGMVVLKVPGLPVPKKYWRLEYKPRDMTMDEALEGARERLFSAVKLRLRADVPLAFCLSGGVDSGMLVSVASRALGYDVHGFSILDTDWRYDERENIMAVVNDLKCSHHVVHTSREGFFERIKSLVAYHDMPVATVTYYMHAFLSEAIAAQGFKVALSGTAADELFTGYYDHYSFWLAEHHEEPDFPKLMDEWRGGFGQYVRNPHLKNPMTFVQNPNAREHVYLNSDVFGGYLTDPYDEVFREEKYSSNVLRNRMLNELGHESIPVILHEDDLNSMKYSVENRSPYLDRNLAEFLYSVPSRHLIHDGFAKWLLRASGEGLMTDSVRLDKRKRGFNVAMDSLIDRADPTVRDLLLDDSPIYELVRREAIEHLLTHDELDDSFNKYMFSFVSAKTFLEHHETLRP